MKPDKQNLYTAQEIANRLSLKKETVGYRLRIMKAEPITFQGDNHHYYTYDDMKLVQHFRGVCTVEVVKYIDRYIEVNWLVLPSKMNFEKC